jgi:poly-gamma-glutamate capsule biosynthesis protein CapA/YwtB (metallophosphatase superfamily)
MKLWQVTVLIVLLAASAWAVVSFHPVQVTDVGGIVTPPPIGGPTPAAARPVSLLFAGDIMLSRSVGDLMKAKNDWLWPFSRIASVTASADLAFANLETTISTGGAAHGCTYCFRTDPRAVAGLLSAGFDVVSVANNHIWDFGLQAFTDTLGYLAVNDISAVGGGRTLAEARTPVVRTVGDTRVAFLAYTDLLPDEAQALDDRAGVNTWNEQRMIEDVARARAAADIVVVSFHSGTEYETHHTAVQEKRYHSIIDAGADLVVGHHPHVVQEVEHYTNGWIAYSLGNFIFDQTFSDATQTAIMLNVKLADNKIVSVIPIPIVIGKDFRPALK